MKSPEKDSKDVFRQVKQVGILTAIPFILLLGPLIGFYLGQWIDRKFGSSPYGMIVLIILGFAGSAKETVRMLKDALRNSE